MDIELQFQLGHATTMHIQRMLSTALDKISRVNTARIEEASIVKQFSVLRANIPTVDLLPYQAIQLQVDLKRFVKDGNTSFLYFTGMFLDAQTFFKGGVHGLNIPKEITFIDEDVSFLRLTTKSGLLAIPTLDKSAPNANVSTAVFSFQLDDILVAQHPYEHFRPLTVRNGVLSFRRPAVNYDQGLFADFKCLNISKADFPLRSAGKVDWDTDTYVRKAPVFSSTKKIKRSSRRDKDDDDGDKDSNPQPVTGQSLPGPELSPLQKRVSQSEVTVITKAPHSVTIEDLREALQISLPSDVDGATGVSFTTPLELLSCRDTSGLPDFPLSSRDNRRPLSAREKFLRQNRMPYDRPSDNTRSRNNALFTPSYQSQLQRVIPHVTALSGAVPKHSTARSRATPVTSTPVVVNSADILGTSPQSAAVSRADAPSPVEVSPGSKSSGFSDPNVVSDQDSRDGSEHNVTVTETNNLTTGYVTLTNHPVIQTELSTQTDLSLQTAECFNFILRHQRTALDMRVEQLHPTEVFTDNTLFQLPTEYLEFGQSLAAFMGLPHNENHWYFVNALPYFFFQRDDSTWVFQVDEGGSATFVQCQRFDSAYLVLHDPTVTHPVLTETAQLFNAYMRP